MTFVKVKKISQARISKLQRKQDVGGHSLLQVGSVKNSETCLIKAIVSHTTDSHIMEVNMSEGGGNQSSPIKYIKYLTL